MTANIIISYRKLTFYWTVSDFFSRDFIRLAARSAETLKSTIFQLLSWDVFYWFLANKLDAYDNVYQTKMYNYQN